MEQRSEAPAVTALLKLVEFLALQSDDWGPSALARQLELTPNLTYRILCELHRNGYVTRNASGQYRLSAKLFCLGMKLQGRFDLGKCARPVLEDLSRETGLTAQLQIPGPEKMIVMDFVAPPTDYYMAVRPGSLVYYHGNAFGKAVLPFLPEAWRRTVLTPPLEQMTAATVTDVAQLEAELERVKQTGVATEFNEYLQGNYCVAAPVFNTCGEVAGAIGVTGLFNFFRPEQLDSLQTTVIRHSRQLSARIGNE